MPSRVLAFLFTDLVGSTEMLATLGDVEGDAMLRTHFRSLRDAIAVHGGWEIKSLGDGLMVAFESPSDAVACAVAMQRSVDLANRRDGGGDLAMRIGIQVGEAIEGDEAEPDYLGSPVVQAKRLCDAAHGGQILVSDLVGALADARSPYALVPLGSLELKGLREPMAALEVEWGPATRSQLPLPPFLVQRAPPGPFIGRTPQYDVLRRLWLESAGDRRIALLAGEPGIGKTRLAGCFALDAHTDGATVLWGRSAEEALVPYQPFVQALDHYVGASQLDQLRDELGASGPDLARFLPRIHDRLSGVVARPAEDPESDRARFFAAVASLLSRMSAQDAVLLVLDDLHWADQGTLLLFRHLARTSDPLSLLVLATYRDTEVSRTHPLAVALADLRRETTFERIELAGLSEADVGALLRSLLGRTPPDDLTRELVTETQGNPFYLEEIVRHLEEAETADGGHLLDELSIDMLGVPDSVRDVLLRRLQRLGAGAQDAISKAAVLGSEFDAAVLACLLGLDASSVVALLDEGLGARLIVELPDRIGRYGFPHALVQHTLYEEHSTNRRALLHGAAGRALEEVYAPDLGPHFADLARHFSLAGDDEAERVVRYGRSAGERALALLAYEDAVREIERAVRALDRTEPGNTTARAELLVLLGTTWTRAGEHAHAREAFRQAADVASAVGAGETLAQAALGYGGGAGFGGVWITFATIDDELVSMLEKGLMARAVEGPLRVRLLGRLAQANYWAPDRERSSSLSAEALEFARQLGDRAAIAYALDSRHVALWGPDDLDERVRIAEEMLRLGRDTGDRDIQLEAYAWLITDALETGPIELVDRYIDAHARVSDELRQPYHYWYTQVVRAMRAFMQGRYEETQRLAAEAWKHGEHAHPVNAHQVNQVLTLFLMREAGQLDALVDGLEAYVEQSPLLAWRSALAMVYADLDRASEALEQVAMFSGERFSSVPRDCVWFATLAMLTQALDRCDAPEYCRDIYELLLPFADRYLVVGGAVLCLGPIARLLGMLASGMGEHAEAVAHVEDAIQRSRALGSSPLTARTELQMARVLRARGGRRDVERARALVGSATETARRIGMPRLLQELAELG
jgi:class 3 adenylate cyclase/tetratricopeptide (TPR) repeat protein